MTEPATELWRPVKPTSCPAALVSPCSISSRELVESTGTGPFSSLFEMGEAIV